MRNLKHAPISELNPYAERENERRWTRVQWTATLQRRRKRKRKKQKSPPSNIIKLLK